MIGITVLGSTGTIGMNTLDVIRRNPGRYRVVALTANRDDERMAEQCREFAPDYAVMADPAAAVRLRDRLAGAGRVEILTGGEALEQVAALDSVGQVMAGIVGAAGLCPTLAAARAGKRVLLANKEALVMSGALFMDAVRRHGAELLPIDSEHNAIFQCLPANHDGSLQGAGISRILLTGSGGPFRETPLEELAAVTPEQACAHPNWVMGKKISVDSATMMNKGLELIEACWLFNITADLIQVVIHPQSIIHSMVEYVDGSVLAQLGNPDMRTPIAHAMAWPERHASGVAPLDMTRSGPLEFSEPDYARFPCLRLAADAARRGGVYSTALNAANEVAVEAFLDARIRFIDIAGVIEAVLDATEDGSAYADLESILAVDGLARRRAQERIARLGAE